MPNDKKDKQEVQPSKKSKAPPTKRYLDIAEIKEDTVVMKDGTLRAVLLVSSINFALKSEDEQNAIIAAYVNFLNTINFPLQIVIQSRKLNIENYLDSLEKIEKEQTNELLRMQTAEYRQYVKELIEIGEIMTKRFYIVVPYNPLSDRQKNFFMRILELFRVTRMVRLSQERFKNRKKYLIQRVEHVIASLNSIGLKAVILDTQSLIELYHNTYNPDVSERQKLVDLSKLQIEP
jgi:hypothetical protein